MDHHPAGDLGPVPDRHDLPRALLTRAIRQHRRRYAALLGEERGIPVVRQGFSGVGELPLAVGLGATAEDCTYGCVSDVVEQYNSRFGRDVVTVRPAGDLTLARFSAALPVAVRYGTVRIDTSGDANGFDDVAAVLYLDKTGHATDTGYGLEPSNGSWQVGPTVSAPPLLTSSHMVSWVVGADEWNWYDLSSFRITATYYVLG